ncbi:MAG: LysR family transcriptional regulator [Paracoccaceae bacterium]
MPVEAYLRNLRSGQLRLFVETAETGKLSVAAKSCNMTTPGASRILADLEKNLGLALFERSPLGMQLTKSGAMILKDAKKIVRDIDSFSKNVSNFRNGYTGKLKIGAVTGAALSFVLPAISQIKKSRPLLDISLDVGSSDKLMKGILRAEYDFAFARLKPDDYSAGLKFTRIIGENLNFVVGVNNELYSEPDVKLSDLVKQMWAVQGIGSPLRVTIEEVLEKENLEIPENLIQTDSVMALLHLLINTNVVAILTDEVVDLFRASGILDKLRVLNTGVVPKVVPYYLVMPDFPMDNPLVDDFLEIIKTIERFPDVST